MVKSVQCVQPTSLTAAALHSRWSDLTAGRRVVEDFQFNLPPIHE